MANQQTKVSEAEIGWFAGFFDGEGTVSLGLRPRGPRYPYGQFIPYMGVVNTHVDTLAVITSILDKAELPYHVRWVTDRRSNRLKAWRVEATGMKRCLRWCQWFLEYVQTKRNRTEWMLEFCLKRLSTTKGHLSAPITDREWELIGLIRNENAKQKYLRD